MVKVREHVSSGRAVHDQLIEISGESDPKDLALVWLVLYKFEAKLLLRHSDIDSVLHGVCALPAVEAKTLEMMAALSIQVSSGGEINQKFTCFAFLTEATIQFFVLNILRHCCSV